MSGLRLEPTEARVLGVLIEKELTTPDGYPLSLNALHAGCNQKSNRDPQTSMGEDEVFSAVSRLRMQQLAGAAHPAGSRVERFHHNARETLDLGPRELAVLAEVLLRGPQTAGELRTRASRMARVESLDDLREVMQQLEARGLTRSLPPEPGGRAGRFECLLTGSPAAAPVHSVHSAPSAPSAHSAAPPAAGSSAAPASAPGGLAALEERVATLERRLATLAERLGEEL